METIVLILVLMEDTLEVRVEDPKPSKGCPNPCSNGRYSRRELRQGSHRSLRYVLILVLMEDTLEGLGA